MPNITTPLEKIEKKITNILRDDTSLRLDNKKIFLGDKEIFSYDENTIIYSKNRYYPSRIENIIEEDYEVYIPISRENISLLGSNITKPPKNVSRVIGLFRGFNIEGINKIIIGATTNSIIQGKLSITKELYNELVGIINEESRDKTVRIRERILPFLRSNFQIQYDIETISNRDYSLLLREIIESGEITQSDILRLTSELEVGDNTEIVIEQQIVKQADWLIENMEKILEEGKLTKPKAQDLGKSLFNFSKNSISGPEHLMEKIITKYGKNVLFGTPVLLNTDKYLIHSGGLPRCQFDIILINHLGDVEIIELKRPDAIVLDFDESRCKFYASKDLSIAISQSERYITEVYKDNDEDYKINGKKLKEFLSDEVGGTMEIEICRPKAIIIMGSLKTIVKDYNELSIQTKSKISLDEYKKNYMYAYKELKDAHKNIKIITYSELLESARTRLVRDDS